MSRTTNGPISVIGRFLFAPADPTPLGLMRILTGLLVLYTTFAYSFDLKWLMGPDAWWNQSFANQSRREAPYILLPLGWENFEPVVRIEDSPHRRTTILDFMRTLPESVDERKKKLRYLAWMAGRPYEEQQAAIILPNSVAKLVTDAERAEVVKVLQSENPTLAGSPVTFPPFILKMTVAERLEMWDGLLAFYDLLPPDTEQIEYVLSWLSYYPFETRKDLVRYLAGDFIAPDGTQYGLPADPEVRGEVLRFLNQWGVDPRQHPVKCTPTFSAYFHITDTTAMWAYHLAVMGLAVVFTVGLYTRVTSVLLYVASLSYIHRSVHHMFGQDTMQTILLLYLMLSPCGAALSVDALRKRYRASRALLAAGGKSVPWAEAALSGPQPSWQANFFLRLFQMHYCMIYLASGASKLKGNAWWNHNATWLTMVNPDFGLVRYPIYEDAMHWLADQRVLAMLISGFGVFFTIGLEVGFIFMIWTRARPVILIWAFLFHTGIAVFMGLSVFGLYMFTLLLCYFPAALLRERVGVVPGTGGRMKAEFDPNDPRQARRVSVLRALDVAGQANYIEIPGSQTLTLTDAAGRKVVGHGVLGSAITQLELTKSLGWLFRSRHTDSPPDAPVALSTAIWTTILGLTILTGALLRLFLATLNQMDTSSTLVALIAIPSAVLGAVLLVIGLRQLVNRGAI